MSLHRRTLLLAAPAPLLAAPVDERELPDERLRIGGVERRYRLYVPGVRDAGRGLPLVVALHGMGNDDRHRFAQTSGLNNLARTRGFAIAYLQALAGGWGQRGPELAADRAVLPQLLSTLFQQLPLDGRRLHLLGFSSGARLALRAADVAGWASVVAHSPLAPWPTPTSPKSPPQLWIHGSQDRLADARALQRAAQALVKARRHVELLTVPGLGHQWSRTADTERVLGDFVMRQIKTG